MSPPNMDFLIDEWLAPFFESAPEILEQRTQFFPPTAQRAAMTKGILPSWTIDALLADMREDVVASFRSIKKTHEAALVSVSAAHSLYAAGATLYLPKYPRLDRVREQLARALNVPITQIECALFCNQPGAATLRHFDAFDTLAVQVTGSKTWHISPNRAAPRPTAACAPPKLPHHELRLYAHEEFSPEESDVAIEEYRLEPGAMLHIPRGYWHETSSEEESVSIHIHIKPCIWADIVLQALRARLIREENWRAGAYSLFGLRHEGQWDTESALAALKREVERLSVDDVQRAEAWTPGPEDRIISRARASIGVVATHDGYHSVRLTSEEFGLEDATDIEMSPLYLAATLFLARSREAVSAVDLAMQIPELSADDALDLVRLLCSIGYARKWG